MERNKSKFTFSQKLVSFRSYCERKGYDLLPDDYVFIDRSLANVPKTSHKTILERYVEEWCQGMLTAKVVSKAQGEGRRRANQWLLNYKEEIKNNRGNWKQCFD